MLSGSVALRRKADRCKVRFFGRFGMPLLDRRGMLFNDQGLGFSEGAKRRVGVR
jgi:hypothetical protein